MMCLCSYAPNSKVSITPLKIKILFVLFNWSCRCWSRQLRHKIAVVIWPVNFSKDLSTPYIYKVVSQLSSQKKKKVKKLHMLFKHERKSLASINKRTFFYINFSSIVTQMKNTNNPFLCGLCFLSLYLFLSMQVCMLTIILTLSLLY